MRDVRFRQRFSNSGPSALGPYPALPLCAKIGRPLMYAPRPLIRLPAMPS